MQLKDTPHDNFGLNKKTFETLQENLRHGEELLIEQYILKHSNPSIGILMYPLGENFRVAQQHFLAALTVLREELLANTINYGTLQEYLNYLTVIFYAKEHPNALEFYKSQLKEKYHLDLLQKQAIEIETLQSRKWDAKEIARQKKWLSILKEKEKPEHNFGLHQTEFESLRKRLQHGDEALVTDHISKRFNRFVVQLKLKYKWANISMVIWKPFLNNV